MTPLSVVAVIVTRDRSELLRESLGAVLRQSRPLDAVLVVDNASSDATPDMLREEFPGVQVVRLGVNRGATGGFHAGIREAVGHRADWLWLLDDDSFPSPMALERLLEALGRTGHLPPPSLLASRVQWRDGEPHPMNMPTVKRRDARLLAESADHGLLPLRATTWVSLLLSRSAVEQHGMPLAHFFYQADDIEYTARILRHDHGYFVPASVVEHRTPTKQTWTSDERRFSFHVRNSVLMLRGPAWSAAEKPALAWSLLRSIVDYLQAGEGSVRALGTVARSLWAGLSFRAGSGPG